LRRYVVDHWKFCARRNQQSCSSSNLELLAYNFIILNLKPLFTDLSRAFRAPETRGATDSLERYLHFSALERVAREITKKQWWCLRVSASKGLAVNLEGEFEGVAPSAE